MQHLQHELGQPITPAALARWLGIDVKTVRKYADRWGGVEVAPKRVIFFERIVEERIKSQAMAPAAPPAENRVQTSRQRFEGPVVGRHSEKKAVYDPYGLLN